MAVTPAFNILLGDGEAINKAGAYRGNIKGRGTGRANFLLHDGGKVVPDDGAASVRKPPAQSVGIADGHGRNPRGTPGTEGSAVTERSSRRHVLQEHDAGFQFQQGFEFAAGIRPLMRVGFITGGVICRLAPL